GKGGYIVASPSIHANGVQYTSNNAEIVRAPDWLLNLLAPDAAPFSVSTGSAPRESDTTSVYGLAALQAIAGEVAGAPVGERNETLNRGAFKAGQLVGGGELDRQTV